MSTPTIKRNDNGQTFAATLKVDDVAYNLTGCTVRFLMTNVSTGDVITGNASIVSAAAGTVRYLPTATDVETSGTYRVEWEVTLSNGKILTFPASGYNELVIVDDID